MSPLEGTGSSAGGNTGDTGGGGGGGGGGGDIGAINAYLSYTSYGSDGDYTGNSGYGGDNVGPVGFKEPERDQSGSVGLLAAIMEQTDQSAGSRHRPHARNDGRRNPDPYEGARLPAATLLPFTGIDIDAYSGLPLDSENPDPFTGLPASDPFSDAGPSLHAWSRPYLDVLRPPSMSSSPYLLAENNVQVCGLERVSCMPPSVSDANYSSQIDAEMAEHDSAGQALREGKATVGPAEVDWRMLAEKALQVASTDEYKLAVTVNHLRSNPLEIRHSPIRAGLGHMVWGAGTFLVSAATIESPLTSAMGLASGAAQVASGLTLAFSGIDTVQTLQFSSRLDHIFALTSSPASLTFGTTGLVLSGGDVDVSQGFAVLGGLSGDIFKFRGDPSKLYSAILPGVGTKAEKGASTLLVKDVAALGYRARAEGLEQVAAKLNRNFTDPELRAIAAFREEMGKTGRLDFAGIAGHAEMGAAGGGGGVDIVKHNGAFQQELKFHGPNTWIASWYLDKAWNQSLIYSIKYQLETQAKGLQLVPLRSVKHIWIGPTDAVKYVK